MFLLYLFEKGESDAPRLHHTVRLLRRHGCALLGFDLNGLTCPAPKEKGPGDFTGAF
jgi:hypothetical protein